MPSHQTWIQVLEPIPVADQTVAQPNAETALWADQFGIVPPQWFIPGSRFKVYAQGKITTGSSNNAGLRMRLRYSAAGSPTGGVQLVTRDFVPSLANSVTNGLWELEFNGVCQTVGTSGTFLVTGQMRCEAGFASFSSFQNSIAFPLTAPTTATVDTTLQKVLVATASGASSNVSMTCSQVEISLRS